MRRRRRQPASVRLLVSVPEAETGPEQEPETDWQRRRRLAAIFGDVLPDTTRDERDPGAAGSAAEGRKDSASDAWLKAQVPPHHGG